MPTKRKTAKGNKAISLSEESKGETMVVSKKEEISHDSNLEKNNSEDESCTNIIKTVTNNGTDDHDANNSKMNKSGSNGVEKDLTDKKENGVENDTNDNMETEVENDANVDNIDKKVEDDTNDNMENEVENDTNDNMENEVENDNMDSKVENDTNDDTENKVENDTNDAMESDAVNETNDSMENGLENDTDVCKDVTEDKIDDSNEVNTELTGNSENTNEITTAAKDEENTDTVDGIQKSTDDVEKDIVNTDDTKTEAVKEEKATSSSDVVEGSQASGDTKEEVVSDGNDSKDTKKDKIDDNSIIPFFIPSKSEFIKDLDYHYNRRTLIVGPVKLSDFSNETISNVMQEADYFEVKYSKDNEGNFKGYFEMVFCDTDTAEACALEIEELKESGILVQHLDQKVDIKIESNIRNSTNSFKRIANSASNAEKIVVVPQLPETVKEDIITERIPNAKAVLIPTSHITHENKRYAYVEMADKEEVRKLNGKTFSFGELKCKCRTLEDLPSIEEVIGDLSKYKSTLKSNRELSQDALNKINEMHRYGTHYERSEYATDSQKEELKNILDLVRKKTKGKAKETVKRPVKRSMNSSNSEMPAKRLMNGGHYRSESWGGQSDFRGYGSYGNGYDNWNDNYRGYREDYPVYPRRQYMGW